MAYHVYLELFEGPLDLLLFLVGKAQIDIKDIFISNITSQYVEFVSMIEEEDMDRTSDFLQMAARLLEIKSHKLLPKPRIEEEEDPEALLVRQLEDYKLIKEASMSLENLYIEGKKKFYREPYEIQAKEELDLGDITVESLLEAFGELLLLQEESLKDEPVQEIKREAVTVSDRINFINAALKTNKVMMFKQLFQGVSTKGEVILTFIALLEMVKLSQLSIKQDKLNGDIILSRRRDANNVLDFT